MIKDTGNKYNDYSISPKIREILLHWGYNLTEKKKFYWLDKLMYRMSYYWFNRKESCKKQRKNIVKKKLLSII